MPAVALSRESGPAPEPDQILFRWGGRYGLILGTHGEDWLMASSFDGVFLINEARREVRCFVADPAGLAWQDVLVRRVLPRVAMLFGAAAVHGAAVANAGGGVVLLGQSGAGKSTLSAALGHAGWDILSDDISILWDAEAPAVAPATTGVCVWADSRAALGLPLDRCVPLPGYEGKLRYVSGHDRATEMVPLKAIVFLNRSERHPAPVLSPLTASEGLLRAMHQRIRFNPADTHDGETLRIFEQLSAFARSTPCWRLSYPGRYDVLPDVAETLTGLLSR